MHNDYINNLEKEMKEKFFSLVGFLFDSIKVVAAVAVLTFIGVLVLSLVRVAERLV